MIGMLHIYFFPLFKFIHPFQSLKSPSNFFLHIQFYTTSASFTYYFQSLKYPLNYYNYYTKKFFLLQMFS